MLHSEYKKQHTKIKGRYNEYLEWCEVMEYTPYSQVLFSREQDIKSKWHGSLCSLNFTWMDDIYIKKMEYIYECKKRPTINQNMCLFYKFYFKRYAHRKNSEKVS